MLESELKALSPYPSLRPGQLRIAKTVYMTVAQGLCTIIEAPCGLGKTIASLMGIALSLRRNLIRRTLWFTRTNDESDKVIEEARCLKNRGAPLRGLSLRGKPSSCPLLRNVNEELSHLACRVLRDESLCPYLDQEKVDDCADSLSCEHELVTSIEVIQAAIKDKCCPVAVMKRLMKSSNILALTYPYVFNRHVYGAYFKFLQTRETASIIDEAHNVMESAVEYESKVLRLSTLYSSIDELSIRRAELVSPLEDLVNVFKEFTNNDLSQGVDISQEKILKIISRRFKDPFEYLWKLREVALEVIKTRALKGLTIKCPTYSTYTFLEKALSTDRDHVVWLHLDAEGELCIEVKPLTYDFKQITSKFHSVVLMSGTLSPIGAFIKVLNLEVENSKVIKYVKPKYGHVTFIVDPSVSTSLKERSEHLYKAIAYKLKVIRDTVEGGLGVFVPSYGILRALEAAGLKELMRGLTFVDEGKGPSGVEIFERFRNYVEMGADATLVSVIGGRLTEGIDISGRLMPVAVVVGLPMPEPTPYNLKRVEKLRSLGFKRPHKAVFVEPAMRKVVQAVGRLIRSPLDRAVVILMDRRYRETLVKKYMPKWLGYELHTSDNPLCLLQEALPSLKSEIYEEKHRNEDGAQNQRHFYWQRHPSR
jgi:DNA excision repair protein ERCC-2